MKPSGSCVPGGAIAHARKDTRHAEILVTLAVLYIVQGRYDEAEPLSNALGRFEALLVRTIHTLEKLRVRARFMMHG